MGSGPRARGDTGAPSPRIPGIALAAAAIGVIGAMPSVLLALLVLGLEGSQAVTSGVSWTWLLLIAPLVQLFAAFWLLARRGWLPMALAWLPIALFTGAAAVTGAESAGGVAALALLQLVLPVLAAVLASTRRVRRWTAG
ncbi:hypothetical protein E9549_10445 [Blastococcus sp. MG754426]|uniref:hypothetical protein n=1 Tax=unclassified Blastococcus TaxID=2619396 RepID=UPI001EF01D45|nr:MULTISPECIES: hypothetical protein [unclassified Blastococcus]MCF6507818.1 hypothetical protein [Blastococcus sp. MG754426]MCF6512358.1 hypothetical protein [Blastococcus sp. MG754427]MCF6735398.1 hypothetical protein [Blastococcus sp. KM273129]